MLTCNLNLLPRPPFCSSRSRLVPAGARASGPPRTPAVPHAVREAACLSSTSSTSLSTSVVNRSFSVRFESSRWSRRFAYSGDLDWRLFDEETSLRRRTLYLPATSPANGIDFTQGSDGLARPHASLDMPYLSRSSIPLSCSSLASLRSRFVSLPVFLTRYLESSRA